jgi:C4-dicarboxylate transporter, DctQ subunit
VSRFFGHLEEAIIAILLAAMTILTFLQVVLRYAFNTGFIWALEATVYLFAWLIMIGISYAVRVHAHIGVDLVVKLLPRPLRRAVGLTAIGLCLLYAGLMVVSSYWYLVVLGRLGVYAEDIPLPRWVLGIILPIGFALLGLRLAQEAWRILKGEAEGFELADEVRAAVEESGLTIDQATREGRHP